MAELVSEGPLGTRSVPTQASNNDTELGARMNYAHTYEGSEGRYQMLKLQINKNAQNQTLKKLADKDSHKVWAQATVLVAPKEDINTSDPSASAQTEAGEPKSSEKKDSILERVTKLFDDLEENLEDKK